MRPVVVVWEVSIDLLLRQVCPIRVESLQVPTFIHGGHPLRRGHFHVVLECWGVLHPPFTVPGTQPPLGRLVRLPHWLVGFSSLEPPPSLAKSVLLLSTFWPVRVGIPPSGGAMEELLQSMCPHLRFLVSYLVWYGQGRR